MKLGLWLPTASLPVGLPVHEFEQRADPEEITAVVAAAEQAGFAYCFAAEHTGIPLSREATRGNRYFDPVASLGFIAARTSVIKLVPLVIVLGYHHPLSIVKTCGTLDHLSGGRLELGLGVGTLAEEFALLEADFEGRGERADDAIRAIRAAMGQRVASYRGRHYRYEPFIVEPGLRPGTRLWIGGRTPRSLRRAVELGDVWAPFALSVAELGAMLDAADRPSGIEVAYLPEGRTPLDVIGDQDGARRLLDDLRKFEIATFVPRLAHESAQHLIDQQAALAALVADSD